MPPNSSYGFFPAAGTDYTHGQEPTIALRLQRLANSLKLHLIGISGYRTPAHSVSVGGFANDPHTRGLASDTPGVESIPESTLNRFGLTRPFAGAAEADHVQLLRGPTRAPTRAAPSYTLADLWKQAGGNPRLGPLMAAIAMAESGGKVDNVSPQNTDGSYDYGLWQINSSHTQFDQAKLISDPLYNARAAVAVEKSQGLGAWTTYNTGAYQSFLGTGKNYTPQAGITRPGGDAQDGGTSDVSTIFASYVQGTGTGGSTEDVSLHLPNPLDPLSPLHTFGLPDPLSGIIPNPLKLFTDPANAVKDTASFLKWIAWIFHPQNILRAVEFVAGLTIMGIGIQSMFQVWKGDPEGAATARIGRSAKSGAKSAVEAVPAGRAVKVARAGRAGKRAARYEHEDRKRASAHRTARVKESKRIRDRESGNKRTRNPRKNRSKLRDAFGRNIGGEDIPF